jgi:type I restriction enzyme S subunit
MVTYPVNWYENRLGDVCKYVNGTALEEYFSIHGNRRVISLGNYSEEGKYIDDGNRINLNQKTQRFLLFKDDLSMVLNDKGNGRLVGKVLFIDENDKYIFNQRSLRIVPEKNKVAPLFLYHLINSGIFRDRLKPHIQGNTQVYINPPAVMSIPIYLPSLQEQQAIASVLSDFDEHIDNLTKLIEKKKAIRDGALEDLVSGRTRLDGFDKEVREYKPIKSVYKRVKGTPITAGTMNEINMSTGAIRVFAGGNTECRTNSDYLSNANIIREPIVIVQSRGVIDFIYCDEPCTFKNEMWGYTSLGISDVRFLFYYLKHNIEHFRNEGTGRSSFSQISLPVTEEYLIPVVSMKEQKEIVDILTAMDEEIESLKIEKEKMIQIKEGAMDDLLTGRVRLKV